MKKNIVIGFFARKNPFVSQSEWSGTVYRVREILQQTGYIVKWIPYHPNKLKWTIYNVVMRIIHGLHAKTRQMKYYAKLCATSVDKSLLDDCDYFFFPGGAEMIPYLNLDKPAIYLADATFKNLSELHYLGNDNWCRKKGEERAKLTYKSCSMIITTSEWARQSFIEEYGINPDQVTVIPFGANMNDKDISPCIRKWSMGDELDLFFSGVDFWKKGGAIAIETVKILRKSGINAHITIAGIKKLPNRYANLDYVHNVGYLNKNNKEEYAQYINLFKNSHLFILPSRAECAGIVFCEASGFGLPSIATDIGGIPDYVINGVNGYRIPYAAAPEEWAEMIINILNRNELDDLSRKAIDLYKSKLNWDNWQKQLPHVFKMADSLAASDTNRLKRPAASPESTGITRLRSDTLG